MKIFPHVYQIASAVADRNLYQYLFVGGNTVLLDTGASDTPENIILPFLKRLGMSPFQISMAINTHADADHHGGNDSLKQVADEILLACGDFDRDLIENPDLLFASRYDQWINQHGVGLGTNPEASAWVRKMVGRPRRIDLTFAGDELISVDDHRSLRALHVPGHSDGHLALYDAMNRAVFVGDALHGEFCPNASGAPSLPPAYYVIGPYLATVQAIEDLQVDWIYSGHWPTFHASQVSDFLDECRNFVMKASSLLEKTLESHREDGATLLQCMEECGPVLGTWPEQNRWLLMYPLHGHLTHLEQRGVTIRIENQGRTRWKLI